MAKGNHLRTFKSHNGNPITVMVRPDKITAIVENELNRMECFVYVVGIAKPFLIYEPIDKAKITLGVVDG